MSAINEENAVMSKRRKIIIALGVLTVGVLTIGVLIIGAVGYLLYSRTTRDRELVFAPTEVGTAVGDKVTKDIGPAGGTLSSPDGRITVNIPPNAVPGLINFSIQPIRNMAEDGLGSAYRLEPNGQKFATPVEVLFEYNDRELGDTAPERLLAIYQDGTGAWRSLRTIYIDAARKTFIALTTHFTDIGYKKIRDPNYVPNDVKPESRVNPAFTDTSFLTRFRVSPERATIRVGESLPIDVTGCERGNFVDRSRNLLFEHRQGCYFSNSLGAYGYMTISFSVEGNFGYVSPGWNTEHTVYSGYPTPRVVRVFCGAKFTPDDKGTVGQGERPYDDFYADLGVTEITIIGRGYRVSGNADAVGEYKFSGIICDLHKPFSISSNNPLISSFTLEPNSSNGGTWNLDYKGGVAGGSRGQYTIEGIERDPKITNYPKGYQPPLPKIMLTGGGNATIKGAGSASRNLTFHLDLEPLTGNECGGG